MASHHEHHAHETAWHAVVALLAAIAVPSAMFLDAEFNQLTAVSRMALAGVIAAAVGVVATRRLLEHRRARD